MEMTRLGIHGSDWEELDVKPKTWLCPNRIPNPGKWDPGEPAQAATGDRAPWSMQHGYSTRGDHAVKKLGANWAMPGGNY